MVGAITVPIKILDEGMELPEYAHAEDAGIDLRSAIDTVIGPGERSIVPCGFAIELPPGAAALVLPRSGLAAKHGISVLNSPGLVDSGYRGEIKVVLVNTDKDVSFEIGRGDRIAQLVITSFPKIQFDPIDELGDTERGIGGFGSSGI